MYSFANKGCEAYTKATVNELTKTIPETSFRIFTRDPEYDALWLKKLNVTFLENPFQKWYSFSRVWQYKLASKLGIKDSLKNGLNAFKWADVIISTNDIFSSTYNGLYQNLAPIKTAVDHKKPVVLIGHSIGPFKNKKETKVFTKTMEKINLINVRESMTLEYLKKIDLKNVDIKLTADPAFCLEPETRNLDSLWRAYNLPKNKKLIGIAPSQGIAYFGGTSITDHFKVLKNLIERLTKQGDNHVLLIPHVQDIPLKNNDRVICEMLYRKLGFPENVTVLSLSHSAEEIRAIVGKLDVMVAERIHAAIAALAQNVPTLAVGYSVKAKGILGDIYEFDKLDDYLISLESLNEKTLQEHVNNIIVNRKKIAEHLSKVIPVIKEKAKLNFTLNIDGFNNL